MRGAALMLLVLAACAAAGPVPAPIAGDTVGAALSRAMAGGHLAAQPDGRGGVEMGPLHVLASITVTGSGLFTAESLGLEAFVGRPAGTEEMAAVVRAVRAHLLDHGHPFAEADLDFTVREDRPAVDLRVDLRPGPGYKYGGLRQTGSRTRPEVLGRLALLALGEDWSESRLRLAQRRLARTGYYEAVVPGPLYRDSTRNLLYPTLSLPDLKGNRLGGLLGYDSERGGDAGLDGYLDIHLINMRGTARDLDFAFEAKSGGDSPPEREARLAYVEPWILGSPLSARAEFDIALQDSVYDELNAEAAIFQDLGFHSRYSVHLGRQSNRDYIAGTRSSAHRTGLGLQYDARDRVPGTVRGFRLEARVTGQRRDLGDTSYYLAQTVQSAGAWANRGRWVGHLLAAGGGNWPLKERADRGDLFELGGANTLRGFREKEFLTDLYLYGNVELQYLLAPHSRASLFAVPALVNRLGGEVHWMRKIGYGLGLEAGDKDWTFGFSYALNPDRGFGDGFIHLRVINNF